jgi:hypothetical protein
MAAIDILMVQPGWDVYSSEGDDIGDVAEVAPQYIRIHKGSLFRGNLYVPRTAITRVEDRGVWLNVPKSEIGKQAWDRPPGEKAPAEKAQTGS